MKLSKRTAVKKSINSCCRHENKNEGSIQIQTNGAVAQPYSRFGEIRYQFKYLNKTNPFLVETITSNQSLISFRFRIKTFRKENDLFIYIFGTFDIWLLLEFMSQICVKCSFYFWSLKFSTLHLCTPNIKWFITIKKFAGWEGSWRKID